MTTEQTSTHVQLLFSLALESQGLLDTEGRPIRRPHGGTDEDGDGPVLVAWSDNGPEMKAGDTRTFMALMAIVQHHGRPHTPTDRAPHRIVLWASQRRMAPPERITDPAVLDIELERVRVEYDTVRLHEGIGYVTPDRWLYAVRSGRGTSRK